MYLRIDVVLFMILFILFVSCPVGVCVLASSYRVCFCVVDVCCSCFCWLICVFLCVCMLRVVCPVFVFRVSLLFVRFSWLCC